jgi:hypothetical protein
MFHKADLATRQDKQNGIRANDTEVYIDKNRDFKYISDNVSCDIRGHKHITLHP